MRIILIATTGVFALVLTSVGGSAVGARPQVFTSRYDNVLGTSLDLKVLASSRSEADHAKAAVLNEINRQSRVLSSWSPDSEFSHWSRTHGEPAKISPELFEVLGLYDQWRVRTKGALNASAGEVINVWKDAERSQHLPQRETLQAATLRASAQQWKLNLEQHTATHTGRAALVLASFTKSYIIDHAADAALREGATSVVLNVGGDVVVRGSLTEPVDLANPFDDAENADALSRVRLHDLAMATSGSYRRGFEINGHHYSHIVDPRTGMPANNVVSSTVIAPRPSDAGALATAFSVLKPEESAKLAESVPGSAYLLVRANGERIESPGWRSLESDKPAALELPRQAAANIRPVALHSSAPQHLGVAPAVAAGTPWDPTMELTIHFELAPIGGSTKRPFMAAWIEDADRFQVRTLAVWYHEDRWVTEMKAWFRSDRMRAMADGKEIFRSVSSATRPPGKYSLKWDGKDNDGKLVKNGKYTVCLEVVREHGTYQLMKQEMDMTGTPKVVSFPANTEVVASSFDYHKLAN